jgi:hypothetical protein
MYENASTTGKANTHEATQNYWFYVRTCVCMCTHRHAHIRLLLTYFFSGALDYSLEVSFKALNWFSLLNSFAFDLEVYAIFFVVVGIGVVLFAAVFWAFHRCVAVQMCGYIRIYVCIYIHVYGYYVYTYMRADSGSAFMGNL